MCVLLLLIMIEPKCRRSRTGTGIQKQSSKFYYFVKDDIKVRVCKNFFWKTLCISHVPVDKAFSCKSEFGLFTGNDKRGKKAPAN